MPRGSRLLSGGGNIVPPRQGVNSPTGLEAEEGDPQPSIPDCPNDNKIIGQEPAAGTTVDAGSVVTIFPGGGGDV